MLGKSVYVTSKNGTGTRKFVDVVFLWGKSVCQKSFHDDKMQFWRSLYRLNLRFFLEECN